MVARPPRNALDDEWCAPADEPDMHPPEHGYLELAMSRIQAAHPEVVEDILERGEGKADVTET